MHRKHDFNRTYWTRGIWIMFHDKAGKPGALMRLCTAWGKGVYNRIVSDSIFVGQRTLEKRGITDEHFNFRMGVFC